MNAFSKHALRIGVRCIKQLCSKRGHQRRPLKLADPPLAADHQCTLSLFVIWAYENDFNYVIRDQSGLGRNLTNDTFWGNLILQAIANTSNSIVALYKERSALAHCSKHGWLR